MRKIDLFFIFFPCIKTFVPVLWSCCKHSQHVEESSLHVCCLCHGMCSSQFLPLAGSQGTGSRSLAGSLRKWPWADCAHSVRDGKACPPSGEWSYLPSLLYTPLTWVISFQVPSLRSSLAPTALRRQKNVCCGEQKFMVRKIELLGKGDWGLNLMGSPFLLGTLEQMELHLGL